MTRLDDIRETMENHSMTITRRYGDIRRLSA